MLKFPLHVGDKLTRATNYYYEEDLVLVDPVDRQEGYEYWLVKRPDGRTEYRTIFPDGWKLVFTSNNCSSDTYQTHTLKLTPWKDDKSMSDIKPPYKAYDITVINTKTGEILVAELRTYRTQPTGASVLVDLAVEGKITKSKNLEVGISHRPTQAV